MDTCSDTEKAKATELTAMGLPEGQAVASAKALTTGTTPSASATSVYAMMSINEDADLEALKEALAAYAAAAKASPGKVHAAYSMSEKQITFVEVYDSPKAMDCHIGNCFPHYVKMVPHTKMTELVGCVEPSELEWWKKSASAWGATKFVMEPNV